MSAVFDEFTQSMCNAFMRYKEKLKVVDSLEERTAIVHFTYGLYELIDLNKKQKEAELKKEKSPNPTIEEAPY